jgi:hypothetical protein
MQISPKDGLRLKKTCTSNFLAAYQRTETLTFYQERGVVENARKEWCRNAKRR